MIRINLRDIIDLDVCDTHEVARMIVKIDEIQPHLKKMYFKHPTDKNPRGYWRGVIEVNGKAITKQNNDKGKLIDALYDALMSESDFSITAVFNEAIAFKAAVARKHSSGTFHKIKSDFRLHVEPYIGKESIRTLTKSDLLLYLSEWNDGTYSRGTTKNVLTALNVIYDYATDPRQAYVPLSIVPSIDELDDYMNFKFSDKRDYFTPDEIDLIRQICKEKIAEKYNPTFYAILIASYIGSRIAELVALSLDDVDFQSNLVHIHSQQIKDKITGEYSLVDWTKDEKRSTKRGGRYMILFPEAVELINDMLAERERLGIESEFLFCDINGGWLKATTVEKHLREKIVKPYGIEASGVHAFRKYVNSFLLTPLNLTTADRSEMLGHSVAVNERYYSKPNTKEKFAEIASQLVTPCHPKVIDFEAKKKTLKSADLKASF